MFRAGAEMKRSVIENCHGGKGALECALVLGEEDFESAVQFMHNDLLEPGTEIKEHGHEGNEEVYFVAEGSGTMILDGREYPAGPGDVSICHSGHSHGIRNSNAGPMRLIVIEAKV